MTRRSISTIREGAQRYGQMNRRHKPAAKQCFRKLLKGLHYVPRVSLTDTRTSDGAAKRELLPGVEHRQHRYRNHRAENAHQPTRQREQRMARCTSPDYAQRFLSAYGPSAQHFRPRQHRLPASEYRPVLRERFQMRGESTGMERTA